MPVSNFHPVGIPAMSIVTAEERKQTAYGLYLNDFCSSSWWGTVVVHVTRGTRRAKRSAPRQLAEERGQRGKQTETDKGIAGTNKY